MSNAIAERNEISRKVKNILSRSDILHLFPNVELMKALIVH